MNSTFKLVYVPIVAILCTLIFTYAYGVAQTHAATGPAECKSGEQYRCTACGKAGQPACSTLLSAGCYPGQVGVCEKTAGTTSGGTTQPPGGGGTTQPPGGSGTTCTGNMLCNPLKIDSIEELILTIIDVVLVFLLPIIILYIMYAGYLFVTAQGNPGELTAAKKALLTALIGGVIVLGARAILDVVKGTIEAVTRDTSSLDTTTPAPTGGTRGAAGGSGGNSGGSPVPKDAGSTMFTTPLMPEPHNTAFTLACASCYEQYNTGSGKTPKCYQQGFATTCQSNGGFMTWMNYYEHHAAGKTPYLKYVCWFNPDRTPSCPAINDAFYP